MDVVGLLRGDADTYAEAIAKAEEVLELLIEDDEVTGKPLPSPQVLQLVQV